ncbi:MAG: hypothetical protein WDO13_17795 [Verrucomicrobiota bacterium]
MYDYTVPDREIKGIVEWAIARKPKGCIYCNRVALEPSRAPRRPQVTYTSASEAAERFLKGFRCDECDLWHASPWRPLDDPSQDALPVLAGLFHGGELVNVVTEYGPGRTLPRDAWLTHIRTHGTPSGSIGCLFRPNPVTACPSGNQGGYTDQDVMAYRFAVLESDILPFDLQLSVLARLPLPVAAITFSGGKSFHALVRVNAPDAPTYHKGVQHMLALLRPLGFDQQTGNPSRMSRLGGATRGSKHQRLVYLHPDVTGNRPILGGAT